MTPGCVAVCSGRRLLAPRHLPLPCPLNPLPPPAAVPIGLSPPKCTPSPSAWPILTSPTPPFFPSGVCANTAPGLSPSHCPVSGPQSTRRRLPPPPLAGCIQVDTPWETGGGGGGQGGFLVQSLVDGAGSYSVAHRAGLLPTELTGMWGWILLRSPHQGRGSPPGHAPTKQRPVGGGGAKIRDAARGRAGGGGEGEGGGETLLNRALELPTNFVVPLVTNGIEKSTTEPSLTCTVPSFSSFDAASPVTARDMAICGGAAAVRRARGAGAVGEQGVGGG